MKKDKRKILLVGGGTGGHVVPVFAIYNKIKKDSPQIDIKIVGSGTGVEKEFFFGLKDYFVIRTGKMHRRLTYKNIIEFFWFVVGFLNAFFFLISYKPNLIFIKGGYTSLPFVIWAKILKIDYFVHESDIAMGLTNRMAARFAKTIFVGFPKDNYPEIDQNKTIYTGQILRDDFKNKIQSDPNYFFNNQKPIILFIGGSQGAKNLNDAVFYQLPELLKKYNILHQVGEKDYSRAIEIRARLQNDMKNSYHIKNFFRADCNNNELLLAMKSAEIIVSRAGATSLAEIGLVKKPMVLVPYKHASCDHQTKNAQLLVKNKAAIILFEDELKTKSLVSIINKLHGDQRLMSSLAENAHKFFPEDGLEIITNAIKEEVK